MSETTGALVFVLAMVGIPVLIAMWLVVREWFMLRNLVRRMPHTSEEGEDGTL